MAKHGGYMGGMPGNMSNLMKQAQRMQQKLQEAQAELETMEFKGQAGGGAVAVTVTGKKQVVSVELAPEAVDPEDIEMLQDLIVAAANEGLRQVDAWQEEHMSQLSGGMGGLL